MVGNSKEWEFFEEDSLGVLCGWRTSSWEYQSSGCRCFNLVGKCHAQTLALLIDVYPASPLEFSTDVQIRPHSPAAHDTFSMSYITKAVTLSIS